MITPKIEKHIIKYLTKSATAIDLDILSNWIEYPDNRKLFKDYVKDHYAITYSINEPDSEKLLERLLRTIRREKSLVYKLKTQPIFKYSAAAILVIAFASTFFLRELSSDNNVENNSSKIVNNQIEAGSNKATLTLEDGTKVLLEKGKNFTNQKISSNGEEIIYLTPSKQENAHQTIAFNSLTVPRGGEFFIILVDGTKVWLNSESQLKYPTQFIEGETREVELVYGEAYFDVSPSTIHNGDKFKVVHSMQEVEVFGTEFNIKAYQDENTIFTTLVEGKVSVKNNSKTKILQPNQQSVIAGSSNAIVIEQVDVNNEISWVRGEFVFYKKPLKDIMKVLSRWYDVTIIFQNKSFENTEFNGELSKNQTIEDILDLIKKTKIINAYEINDNTIILK